MKLDDVLGYQLDMARHAAMRSIHRQLEGFPLVPADTVALLLIRDHPGCDQAMVGRALSGNRSVGMKVASRLEALGLLTRADGPDRRMKSLHITDKGEAMLAEAIRRHEQAEANVAASLLPGERETLLKLLGKLRAAVDSEEATLPSPPPTARTLTKRSRTWGARKTS